MHLTGVAVLLPLPCGGGGGFGARQGVAVALATCSVEGEDRYSPELGGCCHGLSAVEEGRPTSRGWCNTSDVNYGKPCWSTIFVCRAELRRIPPTTAPQAVGGSPAVPASSCRQYMTFAQHSGFSNQMSNLATAMKVALVLNRTLVIPRILSHFERDYGTCKRGVTSVKQMICRSEAPAKGPSVPAHDVLELHDLNFGQLQFTWASHVPKHVEKGCNDEWQHVPGHLNCHQSLVGVGIPNAADSSSISQDQNRRKYFDLLQLQNTTSRVLQFSSLFGISPLWGFDRQVEKKYQPVIQEEMLKNVHRLAKPLQAAAQKIARDLGPLFYSIHLRCRERSFSRKCMKELQGISARMQQHATNNKIAATPVTMVTIFAVTDADENWLVKRPEWKEFITQMEIILQGKAVRVRFLKHFLSFFSEMKGGWSKGSDDLLLPILDQAVASCSTLDFFGTSGSTFTDRIVQTRRLFPADQRLAPCGVCSSSAGRAIFRTDRQPQIDQSRDGYCNWNNCDGTVSDTEFCNRDEARCLSCGNGAVWCTNTDSRHRRQSRGGC